MSSTFQTLVPSDQTQVTFTTPGWQLLDGGRFGIGTVIAAHFGEPISDRAAAERHLSVTTNPPVQGSWYWMDDQTAHWRPEKYYAPPGTSVTVRANVYGVPLGDGLYGEQDSSATFTIGGDAHVSVADDTTKQVSVFDNGKLVRTMPTSMGRGGGSETIAGQTLTFWTPPGVYTVMDKANPVIMDSSTYGLPINSRLGYRETIPYATRISPDGIYLHQLNATVWAQGNTNVSHGCLNLSGENAAWFYDFSVPGGRRRSQEHRRPAPPTADSERRLDAAVERVAQRQCAALSYRLECPVPPAFLTAACFVAGGRLWGGGS